MKVISESKANFHIICSRLSYRKEFTACVKLDLYYAYFYQVSDHLMLYMIMEGYQGHNSNTPYALFHLRYMDANHALPQSDMLHTFFENSLLDNSIWVLCYPN